MTLEQIITAGGSTVDKVTATLVKPLADRLSKAVTDGKLTQAQVREIAELKAPDLNSASVEAAEQMVKGTARSMGIEIAD